MFMSNTPGPTQQSDDAPKRPVNAHFQFRGVMLPILGDKFEQIGRKVPIPTLSRILGKVWRELKDDGGQDSYYSMYRTQMAEYKAALQAANHPTLSQSEGGRGAPEFVIDMYNREAETNKVSTSKKGKIKARQSRKRAQKAEGHSVSQNVNPPANEELSTSCGEVPPQPSVNAGFMEGLPSWDALVQGVSTSSHAPLYRPAIQDASSDYTSSFQQFYPPDYREYTEHAVPSFTSNVPLKNRDFGIKEADAPPVYYAEDVVMVPNGMQPLAQESYEYNLNDAPRGSTIIYTPSIRMQFTLEEIDFIFNPEPVAIPTAPIVNTIRRNNNHAGWSQDDLDYIRPYIGDPQLAFLWDVNFDDSAPLNTMYYYDGYIPEDWLT